MKVCPVCSIDLANVIIKGTISFCPRCGNRLSSDFDDKTLLLDDPFSHQRLELQTLIIEESLKKSRIDVGDENSGILPDGAGIIAPDDMPKQGSQPSPGAQVSPPAWIAGVSPALENGSLSSQGAQASPPAWIAGVPPAPFHATTDRTQTSSPSPEDTSETKHTRGYLPHWIKSGAAYFVTFRLNDSLPAEIVEQYNNDKRELEKQIQDSTHINPAFLVKINTLFIKRVDDYLDSGVGGCILKDERSAKIVADALKYYDGERYRLYAWCIMPNHVHVLFEPKASNELKTIIQNWKSYSAHVINKMLGTKGRVWQPEYFDRIIKTEDDFNQFREYIVKNPEKSGLKNWEWFFWRDYEDVSNTGETPAIHTGVDARAPEDNCAPIDCANQCGRDARDPCGRGRMRSRRQLRSD